MTNNTQANAHLALDARLTHFDASGQPRWQPVITERWDDGMVAVTMPGSTHGRWIEAIHAAHEWLQSRDRIM